MWSQLRQLQSPISPVWPNLNSSASTCAWSVILELSALSREKAFQVPFDLFSIWLTLLWTCLVRFPSILALLFQHRWTTRLLDSAPSQHASFSLCFRNSPLREWETGPWKQARVYSRQSRSTLPTQCGSPTDHNVRPYRECAGGHLWFAGIQINVYEACLAAKGQPLSQLLQPLSWVRFWLCVLALTRAHIGECLCVSGPVVSLSIHVFIAWGWSINLEAESLLCSCVCLFYITQKPHWSSAWKSFKSTVTFSQSVFIVPLHIFSIRVLASWLTSQRERKTAWPTDKRKICAPLHFHWTLLFAPIY